MSAIVLVLLSCGFNQNNLIKHAKWKTVHQTLHSKDAKLDTLITIGPDAPLGYIANIHFRNGKHLVVREGEEEVEYDYTFKDSVLMYWGNSDPQRKEIFRIVTATADSLVLSRTENWGNGGTLLLTGTVYLVPDTIL